jgi:allantoicase
VAPAEAGRLVGARPLGADLPPAVARLVLGGGNGTVQDAGGRR